MELEEMKDKWVSPEDYQEMKDLYLEACEAKLIFMVNKPFPHF